MSIIKNKKELLSHGHIKGRKIALDVIEYALKEVDSYNLVRNLIHLEGDILKVGSLVYDLKRIGYIYVVGAGKEAASIAKALEDILGKRIKRGLIIEKRGHGYKLNRIRIIEASHPVPDEAGVKGSKEIVQIARHAKKGDLFFACITGGCSALMTLPAKGISLRDTQEVTDLLLKCGAAIEEINTVRKHISQVMGGRLAMYIHPAELISLIVVDEVAGLPWGPTVPDSPPTTFADAVSILKKHDLWEKVPDSVRKHLETADLKDETPKLDDFKRKGVIAHNLVLSNNATVCEAAQKRSEELGFNSIILSTVLEGESKEAGIILSGIAKEVESNGRPIKPPCVLIVGGETTVTIIGDAGEGGRNQEFVLGAMPRIAGSKKIVIASIGTDGTDGPTDIAGGIIDGCSMERAKEKGINVFEHLKKHNSSYVLRQLKDPIFIESTGTNLMDLRLLVVTDP